MTDEASKIFALRNKGLIIPDIATRLGIPKHVVQRTLNDVRCKPRNPDNSVPRDSAHAFDFSEMEARIEGQEAELLWSERMKGESWQGRGR